MAIHAYKINGVELPTPDKDIQITEEDMHGKSWRDGAGVMHLTILRRGVISTPLQWSWLSQTELDTIKNACRKDSTGIYKFTDLDGNTYDVYTGADLKYTKRKMDDDTGETYYTDVSLSFIQI